MEQRLLDRLRTGARKTLERIPRKGRIRLCLAVIMAFAGYRIAAALLSPPEVRHSPGKAAAAQGFSTAAAFFTHHEPRLSSCSDTFTADGRRVVAFFSLDTALQNGLYRMLRQYHPRYGAVVVMDPADGRVLALVSYRHDSVPDLGGLFLRNLFPAASIFKTVTAAAAIETAHYTGGTLLPVTGRSHTLYKYQLKRSAPSWSERTFEDAFAYSINPVFARIGMYDVGRQNLDRYSRRFGFNDAVPFDFAVDSSRVAVPDDTSYAMAELASGFNRGTSLSPLHGALIAAAVAENGRMPVPRVVDSICSLDNGRCLYRMTPVPWKNPVGASTARELRSMMRRTVDLGTCRKSFRVFRKCGWSSALDYGGKTGSLDVDSLGKIDWFIGFSSDKNGSGRSLAMAVVTVHGRLWNVHSSFVGAEVFRRYFRPAAAGQIARKNGGPASGKPKG